MGTKRKTREKKKKIIFKTDTFDGADIRSHERHISRQLNDFLRKNVDEKTWEKIEGNEFKPSMLEGFGYSPDNNLVVPIKGKLYAVKTEIVTKGEGHLTDQQIHQYKLEEISLDDVNPPAQYHSGSRAEVRFNPAYDMFSRYGTKSYAVEKDIKKYRRDVKKALGILLKEKSVSKKSDNEKQSIKADLVD